MVLNGPNLSQLGVREPEIYGRMDAVALEEAVRGWAAAGGAEIDWYLSDDEAELVGLLHHAARTGTDVIINPAAFTHYSYALGDAAKLVVDAGARLVEVHLSNPAAREAFRHMSVIAPVATGTIAGFGADSYRLALALLTE